MNEYPNSCVQPYQLVLVLLIRQKLEKKRNIREKLSVNINTMSCMKK